MGFLRWDNYRLRTSGTESRSWGLGVKDASGSRYWGMDPTGIHPLICIWGRRTLLIQAIDI